MSGEGVRVVILSRQAKDPFGAWTIPNSGESQNQIRLGINRTRRDASLLSE